jgi:vacuolar-type H+-ATPase subunit F/Vma7
VNADSDEEPLPEVPAGAAAAEAGPRTRLVFMGGAALTAGFALIGFETYPDATPEDLERLLEGLVERHESALVLLEPHLARCQCGILETVRSEGARIVVTEVPPLHAPGDYHPLVEDLVTSVLGAHALEEVKR